MEINGKIYPLWSSFVEKQDEFIGGILEDFEDSMDRAFGATKMRTEITEIELRENGENSAYFSVNGKTFSCGFDVAYGGISSAGEEGWITFYGYLGHKWRISKNKQI